MSQYVGPGGGPWGAIGGGAYVPSLVPSGPTLHESLTVPDEWGTTFLAALALSASQLVSVVGWGASVLQGYYSGQLHDLSYFGRFIAALQAVHGDGGSGFHSTRNATGVGPAGATYITRGGAWSTFVRGVNETLLMNTGAENGTQLITIPGVRGRFIDIVVGRHVTLPLPFRVSVDGGALQPFANPQGLSEVKIFTIDMGTSATRTVVFRPGVGGFAQLFGVVGRNATGVIGHNMGFAGRASTAGRVTTGIENMPANMNESGEASVRLFDPDLLVIGDMGANDVVGPVAVNTFQANLEWLSALADGADLLYNFGHLGTISDPNAFYPQYEERTNLVAAANDGLVYNAWVDGDKDWDTWFPPGYWGITGSATGDPGGDGVHLSNAGHQHEGDRMMEGVEYAMAA